MFLRHDDLVPGVDPLDAALETASADQLAVFARYFARQARRFELAAKAVRMTEQDTRISLFDREAHRRGFLATGARVAVLMRRGMRAADAYAAVSRITGLQRSHLQAALSCWRRERKKMLGMGNRQFRDLGKSGPR